MPRVASPSPRDRARSGSDEAALPFHPRPIPTVATVFVALVCARLGVWQLHRYGESAERSAAVLATWNLPPIEALPSSPDPSLVHRRAQLTGRFVVPEVGRVSGGVVGDEPGHQLVAVFQPDAGPALLVDRGWVPVGLPGDEVRALTPEEPVTVEGLLVPAEGPTDLVPRQSPEGAVLWPLHTDLAYGVFPRVVGPPFAAMAASVDRPLAPLVLRVGPSFEPEQPRPLGALPVGGYVLPLPRTHHLSYAGQWFAFAALAVVLWAWASTRRREVSDG